MAAQAVLIQDGVFIYRRNTPRLAGMIECLYENFSSWQVLDPGNKYQLRSCLGQIEVE